MARPQATFRVGPSRKGLEGFGLEISASGNLRPIRLSIPTQQRLKQSEHLPQATFRAPPLAIPLTQLLNPLAQILGQLDPGHNFRPQVQRRRGNERGLQLHDLKIVREIAPSSAVLGLAGLPDPRSALFPQADSSEIFALRIADEDISATTVASGHRLPRQLPTEASELVQRHIVTHFDEEIDILRDALRRGQRTEKRHPPHPWQAACLTNKAKHRAEQLGAFVRQGWSFENIVTPVHFDPVILKPLNDALAFQAGFEPEPTML